MWPGNARSDFPGESPNLKMLATRGAGVAQSVKRPTSVLVVISWLVSSGSALGSVLTAQSLEPASDSVCVCVCVCVCVSFSLSAPPPLVGSLCLSLSQK